MPEPLTKASEVQALTDKAVDVWRETAHSLTAFGKPKFEPVTSDTLFPGHNFSIGEFSARLFGVLSMIGSQVVAAGKELDLLPSLWLGELADELKKLIGGIESLREFTNTDPTRISALDSRMLKVTLSDGSSFDLGDMIARIGRDLDAALTTYAKVRSVVAPTDFLPTAGAVKTLGKIVEKARADASSVSTTGKAAAGLLTTLEQKNDAAAQCVEDIDAAAKAAQTGRDATEKSAAGAELALQRVTAVDKQAEELRAKVTAYDAQFQKFQEELDKKEAVFSSLTRGVEELTRQLTDERSAVNKLTRDAEAMLTGSTKAGLSQTYKQLLDQLEPQVNLANTGFRNSIIGLFVSSLPLVIYLLGATVSASVGENIELLQDVPFSISRMIAFVLIMVPGAWYARFAAAKHHALFLLREEYAHRYALCMSVDGFQKQAADYKNEIAAATFLEISKDPVHLMEPKFAKADHPNIVHKYIMDKLGLNHRGAPTDE